MLLAIAGFLLVGVGRMTWKVVPTLERLGEGVLPMRSFSFFALSLGVLLAVLLMLAAGLRLDHLPMLRLLVTWGIVLNVATVAVLALTHAAG